ncbi:MAG: AmmeMemoRadiSam system radical SAM enzyme [Candidatus Latescibacterota bacterium]
MKKALLNEPIGDKHIHCYLCAHHCRIAPSKFGVCGVRENVDGELFTWAYGSIIVSHIDPVEKKPLYHFLPGTRTFSLATIGCNFQCGFCQNWQISQTGQQDGSNQGFDLTPEEVVNLARKNHCPSISYTYTEPTIFFEYALDIAKLAKDAGLFNIFVTNGYMTEQALQSIRPYLDAANVDLKSFSDKYYRKNCKARLQPVLDTIRRMQAMDIWVEVTTLIIPDENDSDEELSHIAHFLSGISTDIPWHISRFIPQYQFTDHEPTPLDTLLRAREIGKNHNIRYMYLGNVGGYSDTRCYNCNRLLVERTPFGLDEIIVEDHSCPNCGAEIRGRWYAKVESHV